MATLATYIFLVLTNRHAIITTLCCCKRGTVSQCAQFKQHTPVTHWLASDLTVGEDVNEQRKKRKHSHRPLSSFHKAPRDIVQLCHSTSFKLCPLVLFSGSKVKLSSKSLLWVHAYKWCHESRRQMEVSGWLKENKCIFLEAMRVELFPLVVIILSSGSAAKPPLLHRSTADDRPTV